jgi:hypothetical protein
MHVASAGAGMLPALQAPSDVLVSVEGADQRTRICLQLSCLSCYQKKGPVTALCSECQVAR